MARVLNRNTAGPMDMATRRNNCNAKPETPQRWAASNTKDNMPLLPEVEHQ
eukprot:CAMPEP_0203860870 /NCGR_PEP_ID=MMETSP0359-20131031/12682_1 /ASSEMBLY_ACC=CAM_ASM_000338 /TAXON_ID=268821 /ORGANISM="Scrippsiella Hangoei, Strain SHTV-5" /LENGTH=50 /DNA_ID=CAMNT_0050778021 /DNA_START=78 /DNA_END=227 /DNA_ORIENTATION=-